MGDSYTVGAAGRFACGDMFQLKFLAVGMHTLDTQIGWMVVYRDGGIVQRVLVAAEWKDADGIGDG